VIPAGIKKYRLDTKEYKLQGEKSALVVVKSGKYKIYYPRLKK
jgi:hypothetical protein